MVIEALICQFEANISMVRQYHQASKKSINQEYFWYVNFIYGNEQTSKKGNNYALNMINGVLFFENDKIGFCHDIHMIMGKFLECNL